MRRLVVGDRVGCASQKRANLFCIFSATNQNGVGIHFTFELSKGLFRASIVNSHSVLIRCGTGSEKVGTSLGSGSQRRANLFRPISDPSSRLPGSRIVFVWDDHAALLKHLCVSSIPETCQPFPPDLGSQLPAPRVKYSLCLG